ncbi:hypothetical protein PVAG01_07421 [Phlyctema vagabunda]|uniref:GPI anchored serine-threonine rich protein n=1 Tax=Phlyctema vagabunda TaxID=108571 RepID=A0ABR4PCB6_9HELO
MRFTFFSIAILASSSVASASLFKRETPAECDTERARCLRQTGDVTQCQTNWTACMGTRTASLAPATTAAAAASTAANTNTITSAATATDASATAAVSGAANATGTTLTTGTASTGTAAASSTALVSANGASNVNGPVVGGLLALVGAMALL